MHTSFAQPYCVPRFCVASVRTGDAVGRLRRRPRVPHAGAVHDRRAHRARASHGARAASVWVTKEANTTHIRLFCHRLRRAVDAAAAATLTGVEQCPAATALLRARHARVHGAGRHATGAGQY